MNFLNRYEQLGEKFDPETISIKSALRISTLHAKEQTVVKRLKAGGANLEKIPFLNYGYWYDAEFSIAGTPDYLLGNVYVQEAASQIPAQALDPKPGETVCDMAAAPGSKTTQIAQLMENKGTLYALDADRSRLQALRNNVERMQCSNVIMLQKDARHIADLGVKFDRILLDAPCSGNFCIQPDYFEVKNREGILDRVKLQRELIRAAVLSLKSGGTLVYSTCSLEPEENEMNVHWALATLPLKSVPVDIKIGNPGIQNALEKELHSDVKNCLRIWPHKTGMQGFFIAKFVKN
ncbi:MAG: RsmB/NOP family class I SAM-dependent RNA methyltransferase [Candidatus Woesearchaeota archaeon]